MKNNLITKRFDLLLFISLSLVIFFFQKDLIFNDPILNYDDHRLLDPLYRLDSINPLNYVDLIKNGTILDLQPVRDLSFWFDIKIKSITGFGVHHLHNVLVWLIIVFLFQNLLTLLKIKNPIKSFFVLIYGLNPCFWNAVCWISARKHLLSTMFILWATNLLIKETQKNEELGIKANLTIISLFILSCFSQPINIGWPVFVLIFLGFFHGWKQIQQKKSSLLLISSLFLSSLIIGCLNLYYYTHHYLIGTGHTKFDKSIEDISFKLLSLGRSFFQPLLSLWPNSSSYYPGNYLNIVGLISAIIFVSIILKMRRVQLISWLIFALLPVLVTIIHMTNIFGTDTYLLNTGVGLYVILAIAFEGKIINLSKNIKKIIYATFILIIGAYLNLSIQIADSFKSTYDLFHFAFKTEPTPFVLKAMIKEHFLRNEYDSALEKSLQLIHWDTYGANTDLMFSQSVYKHPALESAQKIKILLTHYSRYPRLTWTSYYLSVLYANYNNFQKAFYLLDQIKPVDYADLGDDINVVMAEYLFICNQIRQDCSNVKNKIEMAKKSRHWNEESYLKRSLDFKK
jgi:hypothetical protein